VLTFGRGGVQVPQAASLGSALAVILGHFAQIQILTVQSSGIAHLLPVFFEGGLVFGAPAAYQPIRYSGKNSGGIFERARLELLLGIREIAQKLHNDLERVILPAYPQVLQLREVFANQEGVLGTMMSGSGPTVFALFESQQQAEQVKLQVREAILDEDLELFVTRTITHGIQVGSSV